MFVKQANPASAPALESSDVAPVPAGVAPALKQAATVFTSNGSSGGGGLQKDRHVSFSASSSALFSAASSAASSSIPAIPREFVDALEKWGGDVHNVDVSYASARLMIQRSVRKKEHSTSSLQQCGERAYMQGYITSKESVFRENEFGWMNVLFHQKEGAHINYSEAFLASIQTLRAGGKNESEAVSILKSRRTQLKKKLKGVQTAIKVCALTSNIFRYIYGSVMIYFGPPRRLLMRHRVNVIPRLVIKLVLAWPMCLMVMMMMRWRLMRKRTIRMIGTPKRVMKTRARRLLLKIIAQRWLY